MIVLRYPNRSEWPAITARPTQQRQELEAGVRTIMDAVKSGGDEALKRLTARFDKVELSSIRVAADELSSALRSVDNRLLEAIKVAATNIYTFHRSQVSRENEVETMPGVRCWRRSVAIETVGLYIPGGSAPLFSTLLMLAIPATIAGCKNIIVCTPPASNGMVHPAVLAAAAYLNIDKVFAVGGVQAIAAMTFGTDTIPRVSKIFGPGNQYVTMAKMLAQQEGVAIDMPAGPSEVAIFADSSARAAFVAADLLSQAEHGADSQVLLVTDHEPLLQEVQEEIGRQLPALPRRDLAAAALDNSRLVLIESTDEAMALLNAYAPEHLILATDKADALAGAVVNAGSVFVGHWSPESAGDYASGTNHTLPTNGYAHAYSGVSVDSFVKKITFQQVSPQGLRNLGPSVVTLAEAEGLRAHAKAVEVRLHDALQNIGS